MQQAQQQANKQTEPRIEPPTDLSNAFSAAGRKRVETVVETLATLHGRGETLAEVAHDARNMVTALGLYCDLLDEPGVLAAQFRHYGNELRLVAAASRRLVEKLIALDAREAPQAALSGASAPGGAGNGSALYDPFERSRFEPSTRWELLPAPPIRNLARELLASRNLLSALAGPAVALTVEAQGGALPVRLNGEDLTRVLVNLVRNAAEAMPAGGRIHIGLREQAGAGTAGSSQAGPGAAGPSVSGPSTSGLVESLVLTVEDNGPGIPAEALETVFASGYTTHPAHAGRAAGADRTGSHRGLGLAISRSIVEAAGGRIRAIRRDAAAAHAMSALASALNPSASGACASERTAAGACASDLGFSGAGASDSRASGSRIAGACIEIELPVATR